MEKAFEKYLRERPEATKEEKRDRSYRDQYIRLTAEMLERPYIQVKMLTREWATHKIKQRYDDAMAQEIPARLWFGMRKLDKNKE
jgi:hypothetical protein